jgi:hypothetical protein
MDPILTQAGTCVISVSIALERVNRELMCFITSGPEAPGNSMFHVFLLWLSIVIRQVTRDPPGYPFFLVQ